MRLSKRALRADDPLGNSRDRGEEAPRDLFGGETAEYAERERDPCLLREDGMAGHEDEAEQIVPDLLVDSPIQVQGFLRPLRFAPDLFVLSLEGLPAPDQIDRA